MADPKNATADIFCLTPQGFEAHFQLSGEKVYTDAKALAVQLEKDGFKPRPAKQYGGGGGQRSQREPDGDVCPVHQVRMTKYQGKDGKPDWQAHKAGDTWCHGKPANGNGRQSQDAWESLAATRPL